MSDSSTVCIINSTLPKYQPNIYLCPESSTCCTHDDTIACCKNDLDFGEVVKQFIPFLILWIAIFATAFLVHLFFEDDETDPPVNQKKTFKIVEYAFPNEDDYTVEDPIFGKLYESQVPKYATK